MSYLDRRGQHGQASLLLTLSIPVLFGMLGMVVDFGWAYWRREAAKTAANAAAAATVAKAGTTAPTAQSSTACPSTTSSSVAWNVGCDFATQNGFTNGSHNRTVSIAIGSGSTGIPVSGAKPDNYWVSATVTESIPTLFSWVLGKASMTVLARSTVGVYNAKSGGCIYVLDTSADKALSVSGSNFSTGCGVYVFSTQSDGAYDSGANMTFSGTAGMIAHGGFSVSGSNVSLSTGTISLSGTLTNSGSNITPAGSVKQSQAWPGTTNPFSGMTAPSQGACLPNPNYSGTNSATVTAGNYCSGITISGSNNVLFSGIYVLSGGNLSITASNFSTTSTNVLIYVPASNATGQINISGSNANWNGISGQGADGFVIWVANSQAQTIAGSNNTINGVIYMPNSTLNYTGSNATQSTLVVDKLNVTGCNITSPASSSLFGGGNFAGGSFILE